MMPKLRDRFTWWMYPGINLHARLRRKILPRFFHTDGDVLDAGCGNGMLSYESFLRGNRVTGVSIKEKEVERCRQRFNQFLHIPETHMQFIEMNLHDIGTMGRQYDEIICSEVLEHICDDESVCRGFWDALKPGGTLHLCCPNADHPDNARHELDTEESGGHVRSGYTMETYKALLEPIGFRITSHIGIGGPVRQVFNSKILSLSKRAGDAAGLAVFLLAVPWLWLDPSTPRIPYSIYVRAMKDAP